MSIQLNKKGPTQASRVIHACIQKTVLYCSFVFSVCIQCVRDKIVCNEMLKSVKIFILISCISLYGEFIQPLHAQYLSLQGVNTSKILSDFTTADFDISSATGAEVNYTNYFLLNLNYNVGAEYLFTDAADMLLLKTGLSKMYLVPSSFHKAKNKESVSYYTNNWLASLDLNFYNGFIFEDTSANYIFAAEPAWNLAYMLGKKKRFFIGAEIGVRYSLVPSAVYKHELGVPFQFGIKYEL